MELYATFTPQQTAIPMVTFSPTVVTLILTSNGNVSTTVSMVVEDQVTLGVPYGWTSGSSGRYSTPSSITIASLFLLSFIMFSIS